MKTRFKPIFRSIIITENFWSNDENTERVNRVVPTFNEHFWKKSKPIIFREKLFEILKLKGVFLSKFGPNIKIDIFLVRNHCTLKSIVFTTAKKFKLMNEFLWKNEYWWLMAERNIKMRI